MPVSSETFNENRRYVDYLLSNTSFLDMLKRDPDTELVGNDFKLLLQWCQGLIMTGKPICSELGDFFMSIHRDAKLDTFSTELNKLGLKDHSHAKFKKLEKELVLADTDFKESLEVFETVERETMKLISEFLVQNGLKNQHRDKVSLAIDTFFDAVKRYDNSLVRLIRSVSEFSRFITSLQNSTQAKKDQVQATYALLSEEYTVLDAYMQRIHSWGY